MTKLILTTAHILILTNAWAMDKNTPSESTSTPQAQTTGQVKKFTINFKRHSQNFNAPAKNNPAPAIKLTYKGQTLSAKPEDNWFDADIYDQEDNDYGRVALSDEPVVINNDRPAIRASNKRPRTIAVVEDQRPAKKARRDAPHDAINPKIQRLSELVLTQDYNKEEIAQLLNISHESFGTYLSKAISLGLLTKEDTFYVHNPKLHQQIAMAILEQQPLDDILTRFNLPNKHSLNGYISKLYAKGVLSSKDALYLKGQKTVVEKRGKTKEKILAFLDEVHEGPETETIKDLTTLFNDSSHKCSRPIQSSTFAEHVLELQKNGQLSQQAFDFYNRCKNKRVNVNGCPFRDLSTRTCFGTKGQDS